MSKVGGVWEEALLEELIYVIAHLAHTEQHMIEVDCQQETPKLTAVINKVRMCRKIIGEVLFNSLGVEGGSGGEFRGRAESFWCTLKHLSMSLVHCDEVAEKLIKRVEDVALREGNPESLRSVVADLINVYRVRKTLRDTLIKLLTEVPIISEVSNVRCREDLCLEEDRHS